ncbi:MAG TPA: ribosome maturation factor RimM [Tissierellaceae bacterium]|nr:ribosome maturation factor RimM [Tissierellaceae bacterium]
MDYITIGKIISSHGVRGEVKVYPLTDDINRFSLLEKAYISEEKLEVNVEFVKYHKGIVIIKFSEFNNINEILVFKGNYIYVDIEDRIILPKGKFFIDDLIDCKVYDTLNNWIGTLEDVIQGASNDVYFIKNDKKNEEYLIPAVKNFVKKIDTKEKKIIIDPIEGMIE